MKTVNVLDPLKITSEDSIKLHEVAKVIYKAKKATLLTGAGISCNAGIPDFRSDDGLYNLVKSKYPNSFIKGQDLFDISLFRSDETLSIFCTFMEGLYSSTLQAKATETHRFIKTLKEKNKLLRCYTQNIDSLEKSLSLNCGIDSSDFNEIVLSSAKSFRESWKELDVVQLHGNLHKLTCTQCLSHYEWTEESKAKLKDGENPECRNCYLKYQERLYSGKRITGNIGLLRPDIVLYGEHHPQSEILSRGLNIDMAMKCDLVLIMGTSLKVDGVKKLVRSVCKNVHNRGGKVIFVNKSPVPKQFAGLIDYEILCDCDHFIRILRHEIPDLFLTQEQLDSKKLHNKKDSSAGYTDVKSEIKSECNSISSSGAVSEYLSAKDNYGSANTFTPPPTPTKKRKLVSVYKEKPTLKRKGNKRIKSEQNLPSPCSSFSGSVKEESDGEVATDNDDFGSSSDDKENRSLFLDGIPQKQATSCRLGVNGNTIV